jgi:hypothetical protein
MFFGKKKKRKTGLIDVGELHRQGRVRSDSSSSREFDFNKDGFLEVGSLSLSSKKSVGNSSDSGNSEMGRFSTERDGYSKREVDSKVQQLDSVIYKLEQRIEVLERKAGIDSGYSSKPSNSSSDGVISW